MNIGLGIRMAFAGGRESLARMALMALGIAIGVVLILLSLSVLPVVQTHIDRLAWHRTDAASPPTAPDPALWLATTDGYAGRDVIRVHVAPLGPRPPVPPGVQRLPGPGEKVVSPALAELMRTVPDDQLDDRYPGRVVGIIGPQGLIMPDELVAIIGHTPDEMRNMHGAYEIRGFEQPGEPLDPFANPYAFFGALFGLVAVLIVGPVVVFVAMVTRIGGARREQRFAAIRLAGATRLQTAVLAATETGGAAIAGVVLGWLGYLAARPIVASQITLGHGMPIFTEDLRASTEQVVVVLLGTVVLAVATTLLALRPVQMTPLGVRQRAQRKPPRALRLLPIVAGLLGIWYTVELSQDTASEPPAYLGLLSILSPLSIVVGLFLAGPWVVMWISRGLARRSGSATGLIVARRIAADPYSAFRAVSGAALAIFVVTLLGLQAASQQANAPEDGHRPSVLDHSVVAVHVQGAPEDSLAPLMSAGVVVARLAPGGQIVVACADLALVTNLNCPIPNYERDTPSPPPGWQAAQDLFTLPYPGATGRDHIFSPNSERGFSEPGPDSADLPIQTLFVPTDGTVAAQERIRTLAAITVPFSRSKISRDLGGQPTVLAAGMQPMLPYVMAFVLLVAACSLTVSVITGVLERRRPFALLRASGVRLGELRRLVLLETAGPLALTALGSVGVALLVAYLTIPREAWAWPSPGFFAGLGAGAVAAFAVSLLALPFMDVATRHDSVRFE